MGIPNWSTNSDKIFIVAGRMNKVQIVNFLSRFQTETEENESKYTGE